MLEPGHFLTIAASGPARTHCYWRPRFDSAANHSVQEWIEQMQTMLTDTTGRHMQADVPVGAFLSGGIDSSAVVAAMRRSTDQPIKTFTIGYPGAQIDESDAARRIAHHLGCEHVLMPLDVGDATIILPQIQRCFDEPFADMAAIPTWYLSKLAAEHVKVVLCGEGGDELFAGYKRHPQRPHDRRQMRPLISVINPLGMAIGNLPTTPSRNFNYLRQHAQRLTDFLRLPDGYQQFFAATQISRQRLRHELFTPEFRDQYETPTSYDALQREYFSAGDGGRVSTLGQFLLADLTLNMPSAMLTRLDRASMAHSVEARVPFLSHKLVDWALKNPRRSQVARQDRRNSF